MITGQLGMVEMAHPGDDKIGDMAIVFVYARARTPTRTHTYMCFYTVVWLTLGYPAPGTEKALNK